MRDRHLAHRDRYMAAPRVRPMGQSDQSLVGQRADGQQFPVEIPFYGFNRAGTPLSEPLRANWWRQGMMGGANAQYDCIAAFGKRI